MEWKEQDRWMLNPSLHLPQTGPARAEESCPVQDSPPQNDVFKGRRRQSVRPCHAVIGARPYCSPEYSPDFYKFSSGSHCSTFGTLPQMKADASIPLQHISKTRVPYSEKKRLLDKQEEIQEVKQLDEWRPAVDIFTAVLQGLEDKAC